MNSGIILTILFSIFIPLQTFALDEQINTTSTSSYPLDSAQAWLVKMSNAVRTLNYTVSFVLLKPGMDSQPYLWRHGVNELGLEMEQRDRKRVV